MPTFLGDERRLSKLSRKVQWTAKGLLGKRSDRVKTVYAGRVTLSSGAHAVETIRMVEGPAFIEPKFGYVIAGRDWLLEESAGPNFPSKKAPWRMGIPSSADFSRAVNRRRATFKTFPEVISLRHWWEWNYFHFWFDVLGKLSLLSQAGLDIARLPLLLGSYAHEVPFVEQIISRAGLARLNWVVGDDYVEAGRVYYGYTLRPYRERLDFLLDLQDVNTNPRGERRIFISRRRSTNRKLINHGEVAELLDSYGFEEVHPEEMTLDEQIAVFSEAAGVVGVTGAGLANIMFRRSSPLSVIELAASTFFGSDFATLCSDYGHRWARVLGVPAAANSPQHADFRVDLSELEAAIAQGFPATR